MMDAPKSPFFFQSREDHPCHPPPPHCGATPATWRWAPRCWPAPWPPWPNARRSPDALDQPRRPARKPLRLVPQPHPGNATLTDRDGEWVISTQAGPEAEGDWPVFTDAQWKKTNGHYGHGCACMKVVADRTEQRVLRIASATAKPLKACREDRALPRP